MNSNIAIGTKKSLRRDCGMDEAWLQQQIANDPSILGLGELTLVQLERNQDAGGRLDILLKDPEDDTMYEVEVMLGDTDESHIIRTIEYWDNERRKWPKRQHIAVLVAEKITRRFFNVIQLFSHAIPLIAIQVSVIESGDTRLLHFSTVLDTYEEPEDTADDAIAGANEEYWQKYAPATLEAAKALQRILGEVYGPIELGYLKAYIRLNVLGENWTWLHKRGKGKSLINLWFVEPFMSEALSTLEAADLDYVQHKRDKRVLRIEMRPEEIKANSELLIKLAQLVKQSCEKES